jgi:hypothetical protein
LGPWLGCGLGQCGDLGDSSRNAQERITGLLCDVQMQNKFEVQILKKAQNSCEKFQFCKFLKNRAGVRLHNSLLLIEISTFVKVRKNGKVQQCRKMAKTEINIKFFGTPLNSGLKLI